MRLLLSLFLMWMATQQVVAQSQTSSVFRFLEITPTARTAALGGNHVGLYGGDFSLMHLNPAYVNSQASGSVSASYLNFFSDANMGFSSGALEVDKVGVFGLGIRYMGYGDFKRIDENGNELGSFNPGDLSLSGVYSKKILEGLNVGAGLDLIHSSYAEFRSAAVALSAGVFYADTAAHFSAGLSIRNMGGQLTSFNGKKEPLPLDISIGFTKKPRDFPFQLSFTLKQLNNWDMRVFGEEKRPAFFENLFRHVIFGAESRLGQSLLLRIGYDHYLHAHTNTGQAFDLAGVAFGLGFEVKGVIIDLSRNSYSQLGGITRLSLKKDFR